MKNHAFLRVTARAKSAVVEVGQPVELEIELQNLASEATQLRFSSSQKWDFRATSKAGKSVVWSDGLNRRFAQNQSAQTLGAGEVLRFETVWKGAPVGLYEIEAQVLAGGDLRAPRFDIEVCSEVTR